MGNLLFIGRFYPEGIVERIVVDTHGKVGFSNHNFELSLIKGFSANADVNLRVLTSPLVFSYPHNNVNRSYKAIEYVSGEGFPVTSIGFCNVAGFNMFSRIWALKKSIRRELAQFPEGEDVSVVVNTPSLELSEALFRAIRKPDRKITTALIVPDVPECMLTMGGKDSLKNRVMGIINKRNARLSRRYDKYVLLTGAMNDFYHASPADYIVMEGLMDESRVRSKERPSSAGKEIILYTGTLRRIFGVMDLIDAFERASIPSAELWICGSGETAGEIEERAKGNPLIKFFGLVDSAKALELQSQATILANPRSAAGEYTKYSFPSKTIEYLLAGRTVVMNRLPGIPKEYDGYLHYPENESVDAWAGKLKEVASMDSEERRKMDEAGREFILREKTALRQTSRILAMTAG